MIKTYWTCAILLVLGAFVVTAGFYPNLPDRIPMHWNIRGELDGWGPKSTTWLMPAVMLGLLGLFAALPKLSPKPFEIDRAQSAFLFIMVLVIGLMGYIQALILWAATSPKFDMARALVGGVMLILALMGNVLGKIKRNLYMGVRTPWTLANERVWTDTHRLAAWWLVGAGLSGFLFMLIKLPIWFALLPLAPAILWPVVFSYLLYKRLERNGQLNEDVTVV